MGMRNLARLAMAGVITLATVTATTTAASAAPAPRSAVIAQDAEGTLASTVDGTFGDGGTVTGTFTPSAFAVQDDALVATGLLHAVLTNADGTSAGTADETVTIPLADDAAALQATCSILHLVLGPLNLNLLGLNVHLNTVVLDITATTGPGNLLGNLLCALTGILDPPGPLSDIADLLNQILAALGL